MSYDPAEATRVMMKGYVNAARPLEDMVFCKG